MLSFETPLATCPVRHATLSRCLSLVPPCLGHIMLNDTVFFDNRAVSALAKGGGLRTFRDGADLCPARRRALVVCEQVAWRGSGL